MSSMNRYGKVPVFEYPEGRLNKAQEVIDTSFSQYFSLSLCTTIKDMVRDQINACKPPWFIGQTVFEFIKYELDKNKNSENYPRSVFTTLRRELITALRGKDS